MLISGLAAAPVGAGSTRAEPGPGISRELAALRAAHYRDVHYGLTLELAPPFERLHGELAIEVTLDLPMRISCWIGDPERRPMSGICV